MQLDIPSNLKAELESEARLIGSPIETISVMAIWSWIEKQKTQRSFMAPAAQQETSSDLTDDVKMYANEAAKFLNMSYSRLRSMSKAKEMPHTRYGKLYVYSKSELTKWLKERQEETMTIPENPESDLQKKYQLLTLAR